MKNENPHRVMVDAAGAEAVDEFQQTKNTSSTQHFQPLGAIDNRRSTQSIRDNALYYASLGWKVFRLSRSKKPLKGSHGFKDATSDPAIIEAWFHDTPWANLGLATGEIVVIDVDGQGGEAELRRIAKPHGGMPRTLASMTARGFHFFYRTPAGVRLRSINSPRSKSGADGIDVKAHGGFVVLPPSILAATGFIYRWINNEPIAELPLWFVEHVESLRGRLVATESDFAAFGPFPHYLKNRSVPDITSHARDALTTSWSAHEEARLRSALKFIPADDYDMWIRIGMALHHLEWDRSDGTSIAYDLWTEWSSTSPDKFSLEACELKWGGFNRSRSDGRCVTQASIFLLAKQHGWINEMNAHAQPHNIDTADQVLIAKFRELAGLSPVEYDKIRAEEAGKIGIRVGTLDHEVEKLREGEDPSPRAGRALVLPMPEPWPTSVDGAELIRALSRAIMRYVMLSKESAIAVALWVVHAYAFEASAITPRLAITSPEKRCGKTTLLGIIQALVPRPLSAANITAAAMFRTVEMARPTLLIDEADTFLAANEELRGILNSGHSKDGNVIRLVGDDHEPRAFSTWCPTAIAAIGRLPNTIDDRSIKIVMRRRRRDESVERIGESGIKELSVLARKARRWVDDHIDELRAADPLVPNELHDRAADNWRPLLAIADVANAELSKVARHVAIVLSKSSVTDQESWRIQLLSDIRSLFSNRGIDRIPSDDAVSYLIGLDERPWSEMNKGRNMTKTTLARFLKPFEIAPTTIRVNERTVKGYHLAMFEDAFSRYLDPVPPAQGVTT